MNVTMSWYYHQFELSCGKRTKNTSDIPYPSVRGSSTLGNRKGYARRPVVRLSRVARKSRVVIAKVHSNEE